MDIQFDIDDFDVDKFTNDIRHQSVVDIDIKILLSMLSEKERTVLSMRYSKTNSMSEKEITKKLKLSVGTVHSRLTRAKRLYTHPKIRKVSRRCLTEL